MRVALLPMMLACVIPAMATQIEGRQDHAVDNYPEWVTNDYNCVIGCLQIFNETVTERPSPSLESQAYGCISSTCNKEVMGMNIYQAQYIIQMFYATGSIYEDPNMGSWGQGSPNTVALPSATSTVPATGETAAAGQPGSSTSLPPAVGPSPSGGNGMNGAASSAVSTPASSAGPSSSGNSSSGAAPLSAPLGMPLQSLGVGIALLLVGFTSGALSYM